MIHNHNTVIFEYLIVFLTVYIMFLLASVAVSISKLVLVMLCVSECVYMTICSIRM